MRSPSRRRRHFAAACALVGVLSLVTGCSSDGATDDVGPLPTIGIGGDLELDPLQNVEVDSVVMLGDSITVGSQTEVEDAYEDLGFDDIVIQAQNSKRMAVSTGDNPSGAAIASYLVGADGDDTDRSNELWVVALGTNDINQYSSPDDAAAAVNEILDFVPDESPVVWVDTYYRDRSDGAAMMNEVIRSRMAQRGNAVVAPWSAYAGNDGMVVADGVHPTDAGSAAFAAVIAATATQFLDG